MVVVLRIQLAAAACANIIIGGKIIYYNDLSLCSTVGVHDLALEKAKDVRPVLIEKYSLKICEPENVVR